MTRRTNGRPARKRPRALPDGYSLTELLIVLVIAAVTVAMSAPIFAASIDAGRVRQAAAFLAAQCRDARAAAVARTASEALVFDLVGTRWTFRRCSDGNGNGIRRTEITRGTDRCGPAVDLTQAIAGVTIGVDATLPDPDGGVGGPDPVRFGATNIASFSAAGTATAGTVYLRSAGGAQFAVRVAAATGRTRILRFDAATRHWMEV